MAKYLLIASLVLLLGAAGLGFKTKGLVDQKIADLNTTKTRLTTTEGNLSKTTKELKTTNENLTVATKQADDLKGQVTTLTADAASAKDEADKAKAAKVEGDMTLASVRTEYEAYKVAHPEGGNTPNPTPGAGDAVQAQLAEANAKLQEAVVARDAFQQKSKDSEEKLAAANREVQRYRSPSTQAGLTGRVMAVNNGWNFVVIDLGDKQGVSVNSPLLVMRGGQMVARLKITSVEPRTSIADVVGGSMAKGQSVQTGDRVVFAGTRGTPAPAAAGGTGTPEANPMPAGASAQLQ